MAELGTLAGMTWTLTRSYLALAAGAVREWLTEWVHGWCPCDAW